MRTETESTNPASPAPRSDMLDDESLTDVIDQLRRRAFKRALERRPADAYRHTIEASHLVRSKSS
ncbi:MAG TPA: hypothetical protein VKA43_08070 [Gammaproteobacteria bacterium]|nr:hypothetical protein [Gammaproteobacteria bacterium]